MNDVDCISIKKILPLLKKLEKALNDCVCDGKIVDGRWTNYLSLTSKTSKNAEKALNTLINFRTDYLKLEKK